MNLKQNNYSKLNQDQKDSAIKQENLKNIDELLATQDIDFLRLGFDIGSTTIKGVVLEADESIVYNSYRRHNSDIRGGIKTILSEIRDQFPDQLFKISLTGSGGVAVAEILDVPFVQEVIAETEVIERYYPATDCIIELGGEDAKITFQAQY